MAISLTQRTDLITALVGLFDAAPSSQLMTAFVGEIENGTSVDDMVNMWTSGAEFTSLYPVWLTNEEFARNFVDSLLGDNVTAANKTLGADFLVSLINGGATQGEAALAGIRFIAAQDVSDADWGQAAQALLNKVDVATYFATTKDVNNATFAELQAVVSGVTAESSSVSDKKILIDADLDSPMQVLTTGQDVLTGSAGNDGFMGWIFDNQNTAQSGDYINGGAGRDTLSVELGNSQEFAISLKTESVEVAEFRAQSNGSDNADNDVVGQPRKVDVDAQDMNGTEEFWSTDSRADLVIEDVRNNSHETTLGWRNADAGDVDYEVYYSPNHITAPGSTSADSQLFLELLDLEAAADTGAKLTGNFYTGVRLTVDGTQYDIVGTDPITTTYADLVSALNAALQAQGLTTITASLGSEFQRFNANDGQQYSGTQIVLTNSGPEALAGVGWVANGATPPNTNIHTAIEDAPPSVTSSLTQTDVIFDNLGRGSQSGDFLAGNMSIGDSGSQGIQQFNIEVQRDSWVKSVGTTNNGLEVVNVVNAAGYTGDLRIGAKDGSTGLEDVRVFNAEAMAGKVTVQADLDADIIAKYDDLRDTGASAAADDISFEYKTGSNDDTVNISLSQEAAAYDDLVLTVQTNSGNDNVTLTVDNDNSNLNQHWHTDQAALDNIVIDTGAGNDVVRTKGDGEVTISAGTGDDTVYTDNSGDNAVWVFNATTDVAQNDILGNGVGTSFFANAPKLTVTLASAGDNDNTGISEGFESTVNIDLTNHVGNSANVGQALKAAINNDATLSKLLKAEDGPNHSVVITALIDGQFDSHDLAITVADSFPATNSAAFSALNDAWKNLPANSSASPDVVAGNLSGVATIEALVGISDVNTGNGNVTNESVFVETDGLATTTLTFAGVEVGGNTQFTFDGVTGTVGPGNASQIAQSFFVALQANGSNNWEVTGVSGDDVTLRAKSNNVNSITVPTFADSLDATTVTVTVPAAGNPGYTDGANGATTEEFTATFAGVESDGNTTITFDGVTVTLADGATAGQIADAFFAAYNAAATAPNSTTNWTVANATPNDDELEFTAKAAQTNVTDATSNSFVVVDADATTVSVTNSVLSTTPVVNGSNSNEEANDNTINAGAGNDVIVLSTQGESNETIVFTGTEQGNVDIVNFTMDTNGDSDKLDFSAYLNTKTSASGSTASEVLITRTLDDRNDADATGGDAVDANEIVIIDFDAGQGANASQTFAGLTAELLKNAVNNGGTAYGDLNDNRLDAAASVNNLVGDNREHIVMVQNKANLGEYKVFSLTSSDDAQTGATQGDFSDVKLIGTVDLGLDDTWTADNFVLA